MTEKKFVLFKAFDFLPVDHTREYLILNNPWIKIFGFVVRVNFL